MSLSEFVLAKTTASNVFYYVISCSLQNFPPIQQPDVFGMHDNVDISKQLQETKQLFDSVLLALGSQVGFPFPCLQLRHLLLPSIVLR